MSTGRRADAPRPLRVSKSILKAHDEQAQVKPYSADAEDLCSYSLNEPTYCLFLILVDSLLLFS